MLRSWLFIPGDSEKKLAKLDDCGADAVILDLEDAVVTPRKSIARERVAEALRARPKLNRPRQLWVRINPLSSGLALEDLTAIMTHAPDGIMLPKIDGAADVVTLTCYLDALEAYVGQSDQPVRILPVATETAKAYWGLAGLAEGEAGSRLAGLTWGAEDLSAALGASTNLDESGKWAFTYRLVRSACLMAAHAAGVEAIETLYTDYRDDTGLRLTSQQARAEGFTGRIAIHPCQVDAINESFSPSADEVELASRIVQAFDASPDSGAVGIDGRMFDIPHLKAAKRTLALHKRIQDGSAS